MNWSVEFSPENFFQARAIHFGVKLTLKRTANLVSGAVNPLKFDANLVFVVGNPSRSHLLFADGAA